MKVKKFNNISDIRMDTMNCSIPIKDVVKGYVDNSETEEGGVTSMDGQLNIRPRYQRAYIACDIKNWCENLINSILCGFPINRMYFGVEDFSGKTPMEVLDGQQRLITICNFYIGKLSIKFEGGWTSFENLPKYLQENFLNYNLDVTKCMGDEDERIKWFCRINQPNSILTTQELRNSTYIGPWVESAKKYFSAVSSKSKKPILNKDFKYYVMNYCKDRHIERAEILEMVIDWIAYRDYADMRGKNNDGRINRYMSDHQSDENADELIAYYKEVIDWIQKMFGSRADTAMKKVDWGRLYVEYGNNEYDINYINDRVAVLLSDSEVTCNSNIYEFVLMGEPMDKISMLSLRTFSERDKEIQMKKQHGYDPIKMEKLGDKVHAHHIIPWQMGGKTELDNLVLLNEDTHKLVHQGIYKPKEVREKLEELLSTF